MVLCGHHEGVALALVEAAGLPRADPSGPGPLGAPEGATAIVVDSYAIPAAAVEAAAADLPVAAVVDGKDAPAVTAVLSYHLDARERVAVPAGATALLGPDYAPVSPTAVAARRPRGLATALVTAGGGEAGLALAAEAAATLLALDRQVEVFVAAPGSAPAPDPRLRWGVEAGLEERIGWADLAVSAAGSTPYDLACAGVPSAVRAVAANQQPIERAFLAAGLARAEPAELLDPTVRAALAAAGPALIDGYGAFRARDGLLAALAGQALAGAAALPARHGGRPRPAAGLAQRGARQGDVAHARPGGPRRARPLAGRRAGRSRPHAAGGGARRDGRWGPSASTATGDHSEISVTVAPDSRGAGLGTRMIAEATELELEAHPGLSAVLAEVQVRNLGSLGAFRQSGIHPNRNRTRQRQRPPGPHAICRQPGCPRAGAQMIFKDKTILITGGTGSFGTRFIEHLLRDHDPRRRPRSSAATSSSSGTSSATSATTSACAT